MSTNVTQQRESANKAVKTRCIRAGQYAYVSELPANGNKLRARRQSKPREAGVSSTVDLARIGAITKVATLQRIRDAPNVNIDRVLLSRRPRSRRIFLTSRRRRSPGTARDSTPTAI